MAVERGLLCFGINPSCIDQNIRVVSRYYTKIRFQRLADLLQLSGDDTETYLSEMVSEKKLFAKIDRPQGIVSFRTPRLPACSLPLVC